MIDIMLDLMKNKCGHECIMLDELVSLAQNVLPNGEDITSDDIFNVLRKLRLLKPNTLILAESAVDYGYAFVYPKICKTPYGEFTFDKIYFTPDGIERVIDEMWTEEGE